jgi:hypothetical protein
MRYCWDQCGWSSHFGSPRRPTRAHVRDALTTVAAARSVLDTSPPVLLARADESEALIRLAGGDRYSPAELAGRLPAAAAPPGGENAVA